MAQTMARQICEAQLDAIMATMTDAPSRTFWS
jgi:hypothetical protein